MLLAKRIGDGATANDCQSIVSKLCEYSFFDMGIFKALAILTSVEIQKRYVRATEKRKRITLVKSYMLIDYITNQEVYLITPDSESFDANQSNILVSVPGNLVNSPINSVNSVINTQSR